MAALTMRITALESVQVTAQITKTKTKMTSPPKMAVEGQTTPDDYRLSSIDETLCQGRKLKPAGMDKRWAPTVYHESQCQGKPSTEGLCDGCHKLCEKETDLGTFKNWNGRVGEDLMDHVHMLGTAWSSKCVWKGGDVVTVATAVAAPKTASAEKEAKKAAKEAEKEAKKAAEKAEKEAKKAAEKAAKEAEKEAKKAEKAAEKAAKKSTEKVKEKGKDKGNGKSKGNGIGGKVPAKFHPRHLEHSKIWHQAFLKCSKQGWSSCDAKVEASKSARAHVQWMRG
jgi:chemotaxis protein histidine kinase CheA